MRFTVYSDLSTSLVQAFLFRIGKLNNMQGELWCKEREKKLTINEIGKSKGKISNPTSIKLAKMKDNLQHICVYNLVTSDFFNIMHPYYYLTKNEENSRTSSFEEGVPDVGQNVAHEPISYYYGQVLIGCPLKAYWAKGEFLGPHTCCRISPREHKYL